MIADLESVIHEGVTVQTAFPAADVGFVGGDGVMLEVSLQFCRRFMRSFLARSSLNIIHLTML